MTAGPHFWILATVSLFVFPATALAQNPKQGPISSGDSADAFSGSFSSYSGLPIRSDCQDWYQQGVQSYMELSAESETQGTDPESKAIELDGRMQDSPENCQSDFSLGAFDAQSLLFEKISFEYYLEITEAQHSKEDIDSLFGKRLSEASLGSDVTLMMGSQLAKIESPKFQNHYLELEKKLLAEAKSSRQGPTRRQICFYPER